MQPVWNCSLHMDMRREPERLKNTGLRARRENTRTMSTIPHIRRVESRRERERETPSPRLAARAAVRFRPPLWLCEVLRDVSQLLFSHTGTAVLYVTT